MKATAVRLFSLKRAFGPAFDILNLFEGSLGGGVS
jgi:hypothetical protein